ncbi:hypothetical protein CMI37_15745 [Candidatus Pacearchaeota archaeon]|nr:hypothetical protein [Candidatus Pacearchaeota archaeon]
MNIYRQDGVKTGEVAVNTYVRHVIEAEQMLRIPPAWCIDNAILRKLRRTKTEHVIIHASDTNKSYKAPISSFDKYGFDVDRGHNAQTGLALARWEIL